MFIDSQHVVNSYFTLFLKRHEYYSGKDNFCVIMRAIRINKQIGLGAVYKTKVHRTGWRTYNG